MMAPVNPLMKWLRKTSRRVVFRSAEERPFAERKATLNSGQRPMRRSRNQGIGGRSPLLQRHLRRSTTCRSRLRPAIPRCASCGDVCGKESKEMQTQSCRSTRRARFHRSLLNLKSLIADGVSVLDRCGPQSGPRRPRTRARASVVVRRPAAFPARARREPLRGRGRRSSAGASESRHAGLWADCFPPAWPARRGRPSANPEPCCASALGRVVQLGVVITLARAGQCRGAGGVVPVSSHEVAGQGGLGVERIVPVTC